MTSDLRLPWLVAASLALVAVLFAIGWATRENPTDSAYLKILGGGFMFNYRVSDVHYGFTAAVMRPLPTGSIIEAVFEIRRAARAMSCASGSAPTANATACARRPCAG
jgi:hypothetical protein